MVADDLDKHQFAQLGEDRLSPCPPAAALRHCDTEEVRHQAAAVCRLAGTKYLRQGGKQRIERACIATEVPANEPSPLITAAAVDHRERQVLVYRPVIHRHVGFATCP